jgi:dTDP-4-dehydrorhamnose reductase
MNILVLGCTGLIGSGLLRYFSSVKGLNIKGTTRNPSRANTAFFKELDKNIIYGIDVENASQFELIIKGFQPDLIINFIGIVKQKDAILDLKKSIYINSLLPHLLSEAAVKFKCKLIHFSTDCVYSGDKGDYIESDIADPLDFYGKSKLVGEPIYFANSIVLRTSVIGPEINSHFGLFEWFLSQHKPVNGFTNAFFSGFTTLEIAKILHKHIIFDENLSGLYHLSSFKIDKFSLLNIVKEVYKKNIIIEKDSNFRIDRSLNSDLFKNKTGYVAKPWAEQIVEMNSFFNQSFL